MVKIIEHLQRDGRITTGDMAKMFGVTRQSALKELFKLANLEVIKLEGKGRGMHYILT